MQKAVKSSNSDDNMYVYRENRIDFIRGIAVFLMLWGHCIQHFSTQQTDFYEDHVFRFIYSFHMPLFMMISGYLFFESARKRNLKEIIEHKGKGILYPILMFSAINWFLSNFIYYILRRDFAALLTGFKLDGLWFLWSVLSCSIALAFVIKIKCSFPVKLVLWLAGFGLVLIFPCGEMNAFMYPFFAVGYWGNKEKQFIKKHFHVFGIVSIVLFTVMLFFFEKKHYIYISGLWGGNTWKESISTDLFRYAIGFWGSASVIWISVTAYDRFKCRIITLLEKMGKESLAIYALSVPLLSFWLRRIARVLCMTFPHFEWKNYIVFYDIGITLLMAVAYAFFLMKIVMLMKKTGVYQLLTGR